MFFQASKSRNSVSSLVMMSPSNTAEKVLKELLVGHSLSAGALSEGKNSRSIGQEATGLGKGTVELGFQGWPKQRKERLRSRKQHSHRQDKQVTAPARWRGLSFDFLPPLLLLFSRSVVSLSLGPQGLQHTRLPCPSLPPGVCANSCFYPLASSYPL